MEPVILAEAEFWRNIQPTPAASQAGGVMFQGRLLVKGATLSKGENHQSVTAPYRNAGLTCVLVDTPTGYVLWHEPGTTQPSQVTASLPPLAMARSAAPPEPSSLLSLAQALRTGVEVKDRRYQFHHYPRSFVGSEAVEWLMRTQGLTRRQALELGQALLKAGHIQRLDLPGGDFQEGNTFYCFPNQVTPLPSPASNPPVPIASAAPTLDLEAIFQQMVAELPVQDRWYQFRRYPQCFTGAEAVEWLMRTQGLSRKQAIQVGEELLKLGLITHSTGEHPFRDGNYFYCFGKPD